MIKQQAPKGKFRVICVDTFDHGEYSKDFASLEVAKKYAEEHSGQMQKAYVYDDKGFAGYSYGTF